MSTNLNPGLSFGQRVSHGVNSIRQAFPPPHSNPPNKPSPSLSQHSSPYPPQAYQPPQAQQGGYPHHLYSTPTPSPVQNVANVQNGARQPQTQVAPPVSVPRQRAAPPRQMQPQPSQPINYLAQTLNQSMSHAGHQNHQNHQSHQAQQSRQSHQSHQSHQVQPNDHPILSQQQPPAPQPQTSIPPQAPAPQQVAQIPQVQQVPQVPQVPQIPQVRHQPPPPQQQPEPPAQAQEGRHEDEMDVDSGGDDGEGHDSSLEPKLLDGTPFVPREPMGAVMSAPPQGGSYPTLEAIHKFVLAYCTSVGYAVVIGRSKKTVPGLKKVLFVCDRAGKPPRRVSPEMRKRKTSSRKCDCQFGFFAIEQRTQWTVRYRPDTQHLQHNHGPSESPLLHPAARKLDSKMVAAVKTLKDSGVGVTQTLEILQTENPHVPLLPRDIYNARAAINRNPTKVASGLAEDRPTIYSKPHPSAEERIRADLRRELAKARDELDKVKEDSKKEIEELKEKLRDKDKMIAKFEMFIDICNERVMVQRERLADGTEVRNGVPSVNP